MQNDMKAKARLRRVLSGTIVKTVLKSSWYLVTCQMHCMIAFISAGIRIITHAC